MERIDYFILGQEARASGPLSRYLQPLPADVVAAYIEAYSGPGDIVLDPFCQSGAVVREVHRAGRLALAVNFNPLPVLAVRGALAPPDPRELDAATARLGQAPKMGIPLREHLEQLYRTTCAHCGQAVVADYFLWDRQESLPVEKHYHCPRCAASYTDAVEGADLDHLAGIEKQGFHYWYLVERIAPPGDEHRALAQRLLDLYTPRNLYALANLLLKIEALFPDAPLLEALRLLLLGCLDACSSLNASPWDPSPPTRLRPPARFVELNVWRAFERSYQDLRSRSRPAGLRLGGDIAELVGSAAPRAVVARETARGLAEALPQGTVSLIVATPPPLDHVFWTLSYLWSGWLFGRRGAAPLKPLLRRRAARWSWYLTALRSALRSLSRTLSPQGRLAFIFDSQDPAASEALILATEGAGLALETLLYQPTPGAVPQDLFKTLGGGHRLTWVRRPSETPPSAPDLEALATAIRDQALRAAQEVLEARAEPLAFDWLHQAIYQRLSEGGLLGQAMAVTEEGFSPLDFVAEQVGAALRRGLEEGPLVGLDGEEAEVTSAHLRKGQGEARSLVLNPTRAHEYRGESRPRLWWLREPRYAVEPLSDRVERAVYELLESGSPLEAQAVYPCFPGLLTPEADLVVACLASYGQEILPGQWYLRPDDRRTWREQERVESIAHLAELGRRLGYGVWLRGGQGEDFDPGPLSELDVLWHEEGVVAHAFVVQWTAVLSPWLLIHKTSLGGAQGYFVLPEARSDLIRFKLQRSPLLQRALAQGGWDFIKYRHLRRLAQAPELDRHDLKKIVGLEPIIEKPEAQLPLF